MPSGKLFTTLHRMFPAETGLGSSNGNTVIPLVPTTSLPECPKGKVFLVVHVVDLVCSRQTHVFSTYSPCAISFSVYRLSGTHFQSRFPVISLTKSEQTATAFPLSLCGQALYPGYFALEFRKQNSH